MFQHTHNFLFSELIEISCASTEKI